MTEFILEHPWAETLIALGGLFFSAFIANFLIKAILLKMLKHSPGFSAQTPLLGWSMTKSVMATLIGMRIAEGRMALARYNLFPQWKTDGRSQITLANLMAMESGLRFDENYGTVTDVTRMLFLEQDMAGRKSLP